MITIKCDTVSTEKASSYTVIKKTLRGSVSKNCSKCNMNVHIYCIFQYIFEGKIYTFQYNSIAFLTQIKICSKRRHTKPRLYRYLSMPSTIFITLWITNTLCCFVHCFYNYYFLFPVSAFPYVLMLKRRLCRCKSRDRYTER